MLCKHRGRKTAWVEVKRGCRVRFRLNLKVWEGWGGREEVPAEHTARTEADMQEEARALELDQQSQRLEHRAHRRGQWGGWKVDQLVKSLDSSTQETGLNPLKVVSRHRAQSICFLSSPCSHPYGDVQMT